MRGDRLVSWDESLSDPLTPRACSSKLVGRSMSCTNSERSAIESVTARADSGAGASAGSSRESAAVSCAVMLAMDVLLCWKS